MRGGAKGSIQGSEQDRSVLCTAKVVCSWCVGVSVCETCAVLVRGPGEKAGATEAGLKG